MSEDPDASALRRLVASTLGPAVKAACRLRIALADRVSGRDQMIPPPAMIFVGGGDFRLIGQAFMRHFVELAGLRPGDRVLDVGCGIGRMAIPLTGYLSQAGEYHGFDPARVGVEWCRRRISPRHPNFHFQHVDVHNGAYNPEGRLRARDFRFPFGDDGFDLVFLTSVFTHMLPPDLENYLAEIARVLKPGGRCLATMFLFDAESRRRIGAGAAGQDFRHEAAGCLTVDPGNPESAIAYDEGRARRLFASRGLEIAQPIRYGSGSRKAAPSLACQDIIVAVKAPRRAPSPAST